MINLHRRLLNAQNAFRRSKSSIASHTFTANAQSPEHLRIATRLACASSNAEKRAVFTDYISFLRSMRDRKDSKEYTQCLKLVGPLLNTILPGMQAPLEILKELRRVPLPPESMPPLLREFHRIGIDTNLLTPKWMWKKFTKLAHRLAQAPDAEAYRVMVSITGISDDFYVRLRKFGCSQPIQLAHILVDSASSADGELTRMCRKIRAASFEVWRDMRAEYAEISVSKIAANGNADELAALIGELHDAIGWTKIPNIYVQKLFNLAIRDGRLEMAFRLQSDNNALYLGDEAANNLSRAPYINMMDEMALIYQKDANGDGIRAICALLQRNGRQVALEEFCNKKILHHTDLVQALGGIAQESALHDVAEFLRRFREAKQNIRLSRLQILETLGDHVHNPADATRMIECAVVNGAEEANSSAIHYRDPIIKIADKLRAPLHWVDEACEILQDS